MKTGNCYQICTAGRGEERGERGEGVVAGQNGERYREYYGMAERKGRRVREKCGRMTRKHGISRRKLLLIWDITQLSGSGQR